MNIIPILFVVAIIAATIGLGVYTTRQTRTAADFFVAGRAVNVFWNASAISGEYLSAASFMGIAGLVMKYGYDALWYPVCYAAGYLVLLLFIAGPLRRFGAYTIPDFAEGRFDSSGFRKVAVIFVLCIGFFYTMPQMKGAGVTMSTLLGWPYWAGIAVVGGVITFNVANGGMKGITFVQAFQYWVKAFAISVPLFLIMSVDGGFGRTLHDAAYRPYAAPEFARDTSVNVAGKDKAPANVMAFSIAGATRVTFPDGVDAKWGVVRAPRLGEDDLLPAKTLSGASGVVTVAAPVPVTRGGLPVLQNGRMLLTSLKLEIEHPTTALFDMGSYVPNAPSNAHWAQPYGTLTAKYGFPLLYTYSLIIALICGTAGLPHILVRFYTNPDGRAAKRTTFWVMILLGGFYLFTPMWGTMGRGYLADLYANNKTDSVVVALPAIMHHAVAGQVLSGIMGAGAFAAFMSTFSGLLVSMSGALAHDIYGKMLNPRATTAQRLMAFKIAAVVFGVICMLLGLMVESFDITLMVGWAFAIAAASYFPLLILGCWWRGLTHVGAAAGMLVGGTLSLLAILTFMGLEKQWLTFSAPPLVMALLEQPAIWGVPLSITIMVVVSLATSHLVPKDIGMKMLRLHAPEILGFSRNYVQ